MIDLREETLPNIKAALQAHADVLFMHLKFLAQIEMGQVSDEDILDYVNELFNVRIKNESREILDFINNFKNQHLPELKETITARYRVYIKILEMASDANAAVAKSSLALAVQYELFYAELDQREMKRNPILQVKILTALHGIEFVKSIDKSLKKMLPPEHRELEDCIRLSIKQGRYAFFVYYWDILSVRMRQQFGGFSKLHQNQKPKFKEVMGDHSLTSQITGWSEYIDKFIEQATTDNLEVIDSSLANAPSIIVKIEDQKNRVGRFKATLGNKDTTVVNILDFMYQNVKAYYEIIPSFIEQERCLKQMINMTALIRQETKRVHDLKVRFDSMAKKVQDQMAWLHGKMTKLSQSLSNYCDELDIKEYIDNIKNRIHECAAHAEVFSKPFTLITDNNTVEISINEFQRCYGDLRRSITEFDQILDRHIKLQQQNKAKKSEQELRDKMAVRKALLAETQRKNQAYKEGVENKRREKEAAVKIKAIALEKPVVQTPITYTNRTMQDRLRQLNKKGIIVLTALFNLEKGLQYKAVCSVITKQLGGKVLEIGNGSSHKRIIVDNYIIELTCHKGFEYKEPVPPKESVTTGGMYKPHGGSHQSGVMVRFNMALVVSTLTKAGITLKAIQKLAQGDNSPETITDNGPTVSKNSKF